MWIVGESSVKHGGQCESLFSKYEDVSWNIYLSFYNVIQCESLVKPGESWWILVLSCEHNKLQCTRHNYIPSHIQNSVLCRIVNQITDWWNIVMSLHQRIRKKCASKNICGRIGHIWTIEWEAGILGWTCGDSSRSETTASLPFSTSSHLWFLPSSLDVSSIWIHPYYLISLVLHIYSYISVWSFAY